MFDQRVVANPEGLFPFFRQDHPKGREYVVHRITNGEIPLRWFLPDSRSYPGEDLPVDLLYLPGGLRTDKYPVVLQQDDGRVLPVFPAVYLQLFFHLLEQGIPGICIRNVKGFLPEETGYPALDLLSAHQAVHQCGVKVYHELVTDKVMKGCFHRRPAVRGKIGCCQVLFDLPFPLERIHGVVPRQDFLQPVPVNHGKSVFGDIGKGKTAGLDPHQVGGFHRGIAASGNDITFVLPVMPGNVDEFLQIF